MSCIQKISGFLDLEIDKMRNFLNKIIYSIHYRLKAVNKISIKGQNNALVRHGRLEGMNISISGNNNKIVVGKGAVLQYSIIKIIGDNHEFHIGENCDIQKNEIWLQGSGNQLLIGSNTMIVHSDLAVGETETKLQIGNNCMVAGEIRTSDGHSILNPNGERENFAQDIIIEDNVWVCKGSMVLKGVHIHEGSMIAARSIVTKDIPAKSMAAGSPAKVIRENIGWNRKLI